MEFPESEPFVYPSNPLDEVICQLRFPKILRISSEPPASFQEMIRAKFPLLVEGKDAKINLLPPEIEQRIPSDFRELISSSASKAYDFISRDKRWKIALTSDFLALSTSNYRRWENFKEHFQEPYQALLSEYSPIFFSRIGLRYRNIIVRSKIGLKGTPWSELLNPKLLGPLAESQIGESVNSAVQRIEIQLDDHGQVRIVHGLVRVNDGDEVCYLIDNDFFTEQETEVESAFARLDNFNEHSRRLFRWCISESLHNRLLSG